MIRSISLGIGGCLVAIAALASCSGSQGSAQSAGGAAAGTTTNPEAGSNSVGAPSGTSNGSPPSGGGVVIATSGGGGLGVPRTVGPCVETPSAVDAAQPTAFGFSANEVLDATGGAQALDLRWLQSDLYAKHSRADTQTSLSLTFAKAPTAVRFIDSKGGSCPSRGEPGFRIGAPCSVCSPRLEIDVDISVVSGDGALHEDVRVTLRTTSKRGPRFIAEVDAKSVRGAYFTGVTPNAGYQLHGLHIEGAFGQGFPGSRGVVPDRWNGFVAAEVTQTGASLPIMQAHGYFPKQTAGSH